MKRRYYIITLLITFLFISCADEDFFEIDYPTEPPLKTVADLDKIVRGSLAKAIGGSWANNNVGCEDVWASYTDVAKKVETGGVIPSIGCDRRWGTYDRDKVFLNSYASLGAVNATLSFIDDALDKGELPFQGSDKEYIEINTLRCKGELLFIRALCYWFVARSICPQYIEPGHPNNEMKRLPLKVNLELDLLSNKTPEIGTVQQIWDLMRDDLMEAKELLPKAYIPGKHDPSYATSNGRITKWVASAMLAKVYFQRREWELCEKECSFVIDDPESPFSLNCEPIDAWSKNTGDPLSPEVIWMLAYDRDYSNFLPARNTNITKCWYRPMNGGRGSDWSKSKWTKSVWSYSTLEEIGWWTIDEKHWDSEKEIWIVDKYTVNDIAKNDKRYTQLNYPMERDPTSEEIKAVEDAGGNVKEVYPDTMYMKVWGFPNPYLYCDKFFRAPDGRYSHVPFLRLPEMYLNRAIIKYKFGVGNSDPLQDINIIRERAGIEPLTEIQSEWDIERERIIEYFFEFGDRLFYLRALDKNIGIGDRNPDHFSDMVSPYTSHFHRLPLEELFHNDSYNDIELPSFPDWE